MLAQKNGSQRRVPIVAMENIRLKIRQILNSLQHRLSKKGHALRLVAKTVKTIALKIIFIIQKVVGNIFIFQLLHAAILPTPAHRHLKISHMAQLGGKTLRQSRRLGQNQPHVCALSLQGRRQTAGNLAQAAGFEKGRCLKGGKQNLIFLLHATINLFYIKNLSKIAYISLFLGITSGLPGVPESLLPLLMVTNLSQITFSSRAPG